MTSILWYSTYVTHGTDWGGEITYSLYSGFDSTVRGAHFAFIPFFPLTPAQFTGEGIELGTELGRFRGGGFQAVEWGTTGDGYLVEMGTKVGVFLFFFQLLV